MAKLVAADDDSVVRSLVARFVEKNGFELSLAEDGEQFLELVDDETDLVLLDLNMPQPDGFACLEVMAKTRPGVPCVVLSGADEIADAVRAMKAGAVDYVTKPFDGEELIAVLKNALRLRVAMQENEQLKETIGGRGPKVSLVAESELMQEVVRKAEKVAELDSTVLLTGESGVGKGVLARMIHEAGRGEGKPFVTVSCPAMPRELLESELFGHEKGAFTGAIKRRIGKIEAAKGGTLFLDEIGELPLDLQSKFLNVLQDREFQRVGGNELIKADVRLIAATNVDFEEKIREGSFREDLYYRLSVIPIEVPPLRQRLDGVEALAGILLEKISQRQGGRELSLSAGGMEALKSYDWPGNVRQLENELERAGAFCEEGVIQAEDLSFLKKVSKGEGEMTASLGGMKLAEVEKLAIEQTLKQCEGNKAKAARVLDISEKSIYNKMKRLGI